MIRTLVERTIVGQRNYIEIACLSTDTKPTVNVVTGSLALEVDTGYIYAFDEIGGEWNQIAALGGGA